MALKTGRLKLCSTGKVARMMNLSPDTVRRLIKKGELVAYHVGRQYLVDQDSVPALLERSRVKTADPAGPDPA